MPNFKGYLSDLGGPSANMYSMAGRNFKACEHCKRPSCIHPEICPNLNTNHTPLLEIYKAVDALPGIKKSFIGSGVRYDLLLHQSKDETSNQAAREYTRELIRNHVSGRLKIAPEHTSDRVLQLMRKPTFKQFYQFKKIFDRINKQENLHQQIIPYFISSHPGCKEEDMAQLAIITKNLDFHLEQVQDFTPPATTLTHSNPSTRPKHQPRNWPNDNSSSGINPENEKTSNANSAESVAPTSSHNSTTTSKPAKNKTQHDTRKQYKISQRPSEKILPDNDAQKRLRTNQQIQKSPQSRAFLERNRPRHPLCRYPRNGNLSLRQPALHDCRNTPRFRLGFSHGKTRHPSPPTGVGSLRRRLPTVQSNRHFKRQMENDGAHFPHIRLKP